MARKKFIACGMYAFNDALKHAWQALFDNFYTLLPNDADLPYELRFGSDESQLRDPQLLFGHTCGYPLVTRLHNRLSPLCVPIFDDIAGADNKLYSSRLIVPADSTINSLGQCQGRVATINTVDSNSGMNLLRYQLARLGAKPGFFTRVDISGSHRASIAAIANNRAQIAAIDCVSFQLIADQEPQLVEAVRSIGFSERSCGLPLVLPRSEYSITRVETYLEALNQALVKLEPEFIKCLHLLRFDAVDLRDYESITEFENYAIRAGYPKIS